MASVGLVNRGGQVVLQGPIASILGLTSPLPGVEIRQGATPQQDRAVKLMHAWLRAAVA